jgi:tetratricopeptide (TPR) repeat protein
VGHTSIIAEVYALPAGGDVWSCGSGLYIGGRVVLTARHVVCRHGRDASAVKVRLSTAPGLVECRVVWTGGATVDVALMEIVDAGWRPPDRRRPVRWGRLVTTESGIECSAAGFPDVQAGPAGVRDVEQLDGTINIRTTAKSGRYAISVADPPRRVRESSSPWAGMSGAAVFCNSMVTAVVTTDVAGFSSHRLAAVPIEACVEDAGFRRIVESAVGRRLVLDPVEIDGLFAPLPAVHSPAQLLRADAEIVAFRGRHDELDGLLSWCRAPGWFSVTLIVGAGGQGKTRLATHLTNLLLGRDPDAPTGSAPGGWVAGLIRQNPSPESIRWLSRLSTPMLLVLDYAEARTELLVRLSEAVHEAEAVVRLLLLARTDGDWRSAASAANSTLNWLPTAQVLPLQPLEADLRGRVDAWREASGWLGRNLHQLDDLSDVDWDAHTDRLLRTADAPTRVFGHDNTVLAIHMDALLSLLNSAYPGNGSGPTTAAALLLHERRYWHSTAIAQGVQLSAQTEAIAVAIATVWGAESVQEAEDVLATTSGLRDLTEDRRTAVAHWLAGLYPAAGLFWGGLTPDRLGESHVANVLADRPELLLDSALVTSHEQAVTCLRTLSRAGDDSPHLVSVIHQLVLAAPVRMSLAAVVVATQVVDPGTLLTSVEAVLDLCEAAKGDEIVAFLDALYRSIPLPTVTLIRVAERTAEVRVAKYRQRARSTSDALTDLAGALSELSLRQGDAEHHQAGLTSATEAVATYRQLWTAAPATYSIALAMALNNLTIRLGAVGRHRDGLDTITECIGLLRGLTDTDDRAAPMLGNALSIQSIRLGALNRHREGLAANLESTEIIRGLATSDPDEHLPRLANALNNLSFRLAAQGQRDQALAAIAESVDIDRGLVARRPDIHERNLALGLTNLASQLAIVGRDAESLAASDESLAVARRLVKTGHEAHRNLLAIVLEGRAVLLDRLSVDGADESRAEALAILRALPRAPETDARLAAMLLQQGERWMDAGEPGSAAAALTESVALYRSQADGGNTPLALARALIVLGRCQSILGGFTDSLAARREAAGIMRTLSTTAPHEHTDQLAMSLKELADALTATGAAEDALRTRRELIRILRGLALDRPAEVIPALVDALTEEAAALLALGRHDEALGGVDQALTLLSRVDPARGEVNLPRLSTAVNLLTFLFGQLKQRGRRVRTPAHAIPIHRGLVARDRAQYVPGLAAALYQYADALGDEGRPDEALAAISEAVTLRRELAARDPSYRDVLATALSAYSILLSGAGRRAEGIAAMREVASLTRSFIADDPARWRPELVKALNNLSFQLGTVGLHHEGLKASAEAVAIADDLVATMGDSQLPALVFAMNNKVYRLLDLGRYGAGFALAGETLAKSRTLAKSNPQFFLLHHLNMVRSFLADAENGLRRDESRLVAANLRTLLEQETRWVGARLSQLDGLGDLEQAPQVTWAMRNQ